MRIGVDILTYLPDGIQPGPRTVSLPVGASLVDLVKAMGIRNEHFQYIKILKAGRDVSPPWDGYHLQDGEAFAIYMMLNGG